MPLTTFASREEVISTIERLAELSRDTKDAGDAGKLADIIGRLVSRWNWVSGHDPITAETRYR